MRLSVMIVAALLAPAGLAHAHGGVGRASPHASRAAQSRAYLGGASAAGASASAGGRSARYYGSASPVGLSHYDHGRSYFPNRARGYGYGYGVGAGFYAGGAADALATDNSGYDYEGSPQPYGQASYGEAAFPPPPFSAPSGYGARYGYAPRRSVFYQGIHDSGGGAYAYGYNGYAETPALPYGAPDKMLPIFGPVCGC